MEPLSPVPPPPSSSLPAPWTGEPTAPVPAPPAPYAENSTASDAPVPPVEITTPRVVRETRQQRRGRLRLRRFPLREPGHQVRLELRPFFSERAGGLLAIPEWIFRARRRFWAHVRLGPVGFGHADADNVGVVDLSAIIGLDTRFFSAGIGGGMAFARIDEGTRRARGLTPTLNYEIRLGALDGLHAEWAMSLTWVSTQPVVTATRMRVRFPIGSSGNLIDIETVGALNLAYIYGLIGLEARLPWNRESKWRLRPNLGITEVIDPVRRDGGPGFTLGLTIVYRATEPPASSSVVTPS